MAASVARSIAAIMPCMQITVVDHPLAAQLLTRLRDQHRPGAAFRRAMDDLSGMLVYEATRDLAVDADPGRRRRWHPTTGVAVDQPPLVVPVLRAGLGMLGAVLRPPAGDGHRLHRRGTQRGDASCPSPT